MTAMRSPRWKASSMSCVTSTMVVPKRRWIARRSSCALPRMIGSSAPNGSSISSSVGLCGQRPRHADALLLAARELVRKLAGELRRIELEQIEQLLDARRRSALRSQPSRRGTVAMFCGHRAVRKQAVALDGIADAAAQLVARGSPAVSSPSISTRPAVGSTRRLIMRSRVDLPEPEVPTMTAIVPLARPSSTRRRRRCVSP